MEDEFEVIDVGIQYNIEDDSDTTSVSSEDNDGSECYEEGSDVESATTDKDDDANFSSVEDEEEVVDQTEKSVNTEDVSEIESEDESDEENDEDSDDGQYVDDSNKEEYGDIV